MGHFEQRPLKLSVQASWGGGPLTPGMLAGIALILGGTLLFVDNLAILPFDISNAFWPLVLLVISTMGIYRTRSLAIRIWAVTGVVAAALLLLQTFHFIRQSADIVWPLALIATGLVLLVYRLRWRDFTNRVSIGSNSRGTTTVGRLQEAAIFSGIKRRVETANLEGGELNTVFGSIELDLQRAGIGNADRVVELEANAVFGSIEIRIPDNWRLQMQGHAVFGAYEDKTIPPRPEPGVILPLLIVRGGTAFGAVVIRN